MTAFDPKRTFRNTNKNSLNVIKKHSLLSTVIFIIMTFPMAALAELTLYFWTPGDLHLSVLSPRALKSTSYPLLLRSDENNDEAVAYEYKDDVISILATQLREEKPGSDPVEATNKMINFLRENKTVSKLKILRQTTEAYFAPTRQGDIDASGTFTVDGKLRRFLLATSKRKRYLWHVLVTYDAEDASAHAAGVRIIDKICLFGNRHTRSAYCMIKRSPFDYPKEWNE